MHLKSLWRQKKKKKHFDNYRLYKPLSHLWSGLDSETLHFSVLLARWWSLPAVTRTLLWASIILSHRESEEKPAN